MRGQSFWEEQHSNRIMMKYLIGLLEEKEKKSLYLCIALCILGLVVDLLSVYMIFPVISGVFREGVSEERLRQIIFVGMAYLVKGVFTLLRVKALNSFLKDCAQGWSIKIYELYCKEELLEHNQRSAVQQIAGIRTDTELCADIMITSINRFIRLFALIGYFVFAGYTAHWIGIGICALVVTFIMLLFAHYRSRIIQYGEKKRKGDIKTATLITTAYGAYKEMKVDFRAENLLKKYERASREHAQVQKDFVSTSERMGILFQCLMQSGIFFLLAFLLAAGIDVSQFWTEIIICMMILLQLLPDMASMIAESNRIQFGKKSYEMFYENMERYRGLKRKEKQEMGIRRKKVTFTKGLKIENLTFRYPNGEEILRDASMEIPAGHSTAIIGNSGIGKTTLLDLILGLLTPESGHIWYDDYDLVEGKDSQGICKIDLGSIVSYIPQVTYLNGDTIRNNVAFMVEEEDEERIISCLKRAQVWEDIRKMPEGIDTLIGENGTALSGGQRQRIALARALYKEFELLIMDEATSSLDAETENAVGESIYHMGGNKTLLAVTHHLNLAAGCEFIYKIEGKKLIRIR